jgi:hypothetical protein
LRGIRRGQLPRSAGGALKKRAHDAGTTSSVKVLSARFLLRYLE